MLSNEEILKGLEKIPKNDLAKLLDGQSELAAKIAEINDHKELRSKGEKRWKDGYPTLVQLLVKYCGDELTWWDGWVADYDFEFDPLTLVILLRRVDGEQRIVKLSLVPPGS